jgi:hypothetical protein
MRKTIVSSCFGALAMSTSIANAAQPHLAFHNQIVYRIDDAGASPLFRKAFAVDIASSHNQMLAVLHCEDECVVTLLDIDGTIRQNVEAAEATGMRWTSSTDLEVEYGPKNAVQIFRLVNGKLSKIWEINDAWSCASAPQSSAPICALIGDTISFGNRTIYKLDPYGSGDSKSLRFTSRIAEKFTLPLVDQYAISIVRTEGPQFRIDIVSELTRQTLFTDELGRLETIIDDRPVRLHVSKDILNASLLQVAAEVGETVQPKRSNFAGLSVSNQSMVTVVALFGDQLHAIALAPEGHNYKQIADLRFPRSSFDEILETSYDQKSGTFSFRTRREYVKLLRQDGRVKLKRTPLQKHAETFEYGEVKGTAVTLDAAWR